MAKQAGKGDKPRPTNKETYNANYDLIDWGRPKKDSEKKQMEHISMKNCP